MRRSMRSKRSLRCDICPGTLVLEAPVLLLPELLMPALGALSLLDLSTAMSFCSCVTALHTARCSSTSVGIGAASVTCVSCVYSRNPMALNVPPVAPIAIATATLAPRRTFWPMVWGALPFAPLGACSEAACAVVAAPDGVAMVVPVIMPVVPILGDPIGNHRGY